MENKNNSLLTHPVLKLAALCFLLATFFVPEFHARDINLKEYVLVANDVIEISGASIISGCVHSNNAVKVLDNPEINERVSAVGNIDIIDPSKITVSPEHTSHLNVIPKVNISKYKQINKSLILEYTKLNGCFFVNGDVIIKGKFSGEVSIVATGNIEINGDMDIETISNNPVLYTAKGEISISGSGEITGLIYANKISVSGTVKLIPVKAPRNIKREMKVLLQYMGIGVADETQAGSESYDAEQFSRPIMARGTSKNTHKRPTIGTNVKYRRNKSDTKTKVTILTQEHVTIRHYMIPPSKERFKKFNEVELWDGKDSSGREVPDGTYYILLDIQHPKGRKETKTFLIEKGK